MERARPPSVFQILWDALAWITVIFPVVTGGVWIHRPGLKVELTQINVPVILLAAAALLLWRIGRIDVRQTTSVRAILRLWNGWQDYLTRKPIASILVASAAVALLFASVAIRRHHAFETSIDLGIFTNTIWNLVHGNGYHCSIKQGASLFADHQSPVFWLCAPFYALIQKPETLLVLQAATLASGAIPLYFLARQYDSKNLAVSALLPLLYWSYLPIRNANAFDFHAEVVLVPAFLAFIAAAQSSSRTMRWLAIPLFVLGLASKESAGPLSVGVGLSWLLGAAPAEARRHTRAIAIPVILAGFALFALDVVAVPRWLGRDYAYSTYYADFGEGIGSILLAPVTHPALFFERLFGFTRLRFLAFLLAPLAFVPLLAWRPALSAIPCLVMLFLAKSDHRVSTHYYYGLEATVGFFWAVCAAFVPGSKKWQQLLPPRTLLVVLALASLACFGRSEAFRIRWHQPTPHQQWMRQKLVPLIQTEASVSAPGALVPHLAGRAWISPLPQIEQPQAEQNKTPIDCVVFDSQINQYPMSGREPVDTEKSLPSRGYQLIYTCDTLQVYQSRQSRVGCLTARPSCPSS